MGDMDSGNSGSMQSSSTGGGGVGGDDQEFESHGGDSSMTCFPSFFNNNNNNNPTVVNYQVAPFDNNARLLQLYSLNNGSSSLNIFDQHQQQGQVHFGSLESGSYNNNSSSHLENMMWANKFGPIRSSSSDDHATNCTTTNTTPTGGGYNNPQPHHQLGPAPLPGGPSSENSPRSSNQNASVGGVSSGGGGGGPGRNPKKRSRASRRAPTTVLTTDTSNFRQMVQEFTGIPAPPFSASGFPSRSRLDLFGGMGMGMGMGIGMGIGSGMGILPRTGGGGGGGGSSNSMDPPSYLLRPFAQKILPHPSPPPNPQQPQQQRNSVTSTSTNTNALTNATAAAASSSSGANAGTIPAAFHLSPQPSNPMLSFQSLLQQSSSSLIQEGSGMDNLGSQGAGPPVSLGAGSGPRGESEPQNWAGLPQGLGLTQEPTDTNNSERVGAINSTSGNHGGGVIRGERGMVDSWICSSDN